jgi:predicted alpha-1,6-mannanase (GH76 family)
MKIGLQSLMLNYESNSGLWDTEGWWGAANSVTILGEAAELDRSTDHIEIISNTYSRAQRRFPLFRNEFYDDEGWWALAWIQAYDVTHRGVYLKMAESLFHDMTGGWDNTCDGGIWWKKDRKYKNAIANELFLSVAAHLAARTTGRDQNTFLKWAKHEVNWFNHSGMINEHQLVNDGLDSSCKNNGRTTWSYNQGVIMGGLVELSRVTGDPTFIDEAKLIAEAALSHLTDANRVLHDRTEPHCSEDTVQFKGIFARNLLSLYRADPDKKYAEFLDKNAAAVWNNARNPDNQFSCSWSGPPDNRGAGATTSALGVLVASASMK